MRSSHGLLSDCDAREEVKVNGVAEARFVAKRNGPVRRGFHFGSDDVALPISLAGRYIAGHNEIGQRRERDVMRAPNAGFEHAAAPDGDAGGLRDVMNALGFREAAHAAELDVD